MPEESAHKRKMLQRLTSFFRALAQDEQGLQVTREVLAMQHSFHPQTVFEELAGGERTLSRSHVFAFCQAHRLRTSEEEVGLVLRSYGFGERLSYGQFLEYVYPANEQAIRQICAQ